MKSIKYILIVGLTMSAFTSCNSDDITAGNNAVAYGDLQKYEVEALVYDNENDTRSAYDATTNQLYWQEGDCIGVYEKNLYECDSYVFRSSQQAFIPFAAQTNISSSAAFALYPEEYVYMPGWTTKGVKAIFQMPALYIYNADSEDVTTVSGKTIYRGNLPMWGIASGEFGNISLNMKYLSGVMMVNLKGVKDKASYIKVSSEEMPLSGGLEIIIADKKGVVNNNCQIQEGTSSLTAKNYIIVDLRAIPNSDAVIYLPIVPAVYNDLTVSYTEGVLTYDDEKNLVESSIDNVVWKPIKTYAKGKQIKRGTGYKVNYQF